MKTKLIGLVLVSSAGMFAAGDAGKRIDDAARVYKEINAAPDKGIPRNLIDNAKCVVIVPGLKKGGFVVGAQYGKGVAVCRETNARGWSAPSTVRIEGGSFGAQIGGGEVDVVMLVMNDDGMRKLSKGDFTLGANASAMAGPVGRSASADTDAYMRAEILSWSRSRGAFVGVTLNGATLRQDKKDNEEIYGKTVDQEAILTGKVQPPAAANALYAVLNAAGTTGSHEAERTRTHDRKK